jgi:transposase
MSKTFRPWDIDQAWLLPPSVHDFVASDHPAHLIREIVREQLDLGSILATYEEPRDYPPFHPGMMTALLLYAYAQGIYASRRIARACEALLAPSADVGGQHGAERVDVMAVTGLARPDFRTINQFRKRHLEALAGLFVQVLGLCRRAGLSQAAEHSTTPALKPAPKPTTQQRRYVDRLLALARSGRCHRLRDRGRRGPSAQGLAARYRLPARLADVPERMKLAGRRGGPRRSLYASMRARPHDLRCRS